MVRCKNVILTSHVTVNAILKRPVETNAFTRKTCLDTTLYYGIEAVPFHFDQTQNKKRVMVTWVGQTNKLERNIHDSLRFADYLEIPKCVCVCVEPHIDHRVMATRSLTSASVADVPYTLASRARKSTHVAH